MFELMQVVTSTDVSVYVELIKELGITLGVVGGIVVAVASMIKAHSSNVKVDNVASEAIKAGQYMTAMGQKTVEQEERMQIIGEAVVKLSPDDLKKWLATNRVTAEELTERARVARKQLEILDSQIPRESKANNIRNLPRERI